MATLHLIHGFIGMGKTTFSRELAQRTGALHLSSDAWVVPLFGNNPPAEGFWEKIRAIEALQWQMTLHTLKLGGDVILDYGFWSRARRDEFRQRCAAAGISGQWYSATCDRDTARTRALRRSEVPQPDQLYIEPNTFDVLWPQYEPLAADEAAVLF